MNIIFRKIKTLINHPNTLLIKILFQFSYCFSDSSYLKLMYFLHFGKRLDLLNPVSFNEKLQWLKLNYLKPEFTTLVDKCAVKDYVSRKIGEKYIIKNYSKWKNLSEIDIESLPQKFVLKTTFGGGSHGVIVCSNKDLFDLSKAITELKKSYNLDLFKFGREWPYKNVPKMILCEEYLFDNEIGELRDYKFFCFNGLARYCKVDFNRFSGHRANYYDLNWNLQKWGENECPPDYYKIIERPCNFDKMVELANILAEGFPFVRIDLYNIQGRIYFGEITFYPASGFGSFTNKEIDYRWGQFLQLPNKCIDKGYENT